MVLPGGGEGGGARAHFPNSGWKSSQMDIVIDILTKIVEKRTNFKTQFTKYTKYRLQLINIDGSSF